METELTHIKRFLERNNAVAADFSEDYVFNCPPSITPKFYLEKITLINGSLVFRGRRWLDGGDVVVITEKDMEHKYLVEVRKFLSDNRGYIERYANFTAK